MKKVIIFLGLIVFAITINAQTVDKYVPLNSGYAYWSGGASDTINGTTTADAVFYIEQAAKSRYTLSFFVSGDTLNGCSGNVTIQAQGSYEGTSDFDNIGSSVTWTTTADYDANTVLNTYTNVASGSYSSAAYNILQDTTGMQYYFADTVKVPAITYTDARTFTTTLPGLDYRYIKILLTGSSGARVELQGVAVKVTPIDF